MKIKLYDRVLLKDGHLASVVEILDGGHSFILDIDKNGDTYTKEITIDKIEKVM